MYHQNEGERQKKRPHKFPEAKRKHFVRKFIHVYIGYVLLHVRKHRELRLPTVPSRVSHRRENVSSSKTSERLLSLYFSFFFYTYIHKL